MYFFSANGSFLRNNIVEEFLDYNNQQINVDTDTNPENPLNIFGNNSNNQLIRSENDIIPLAESNIFDAYNITDKNIMGIGVDFLNLPVSEDIPEENFNLLEDKNVMSEMEFDEDNKILDFGDDNKILDINKLCFKNPEDLQDKICIDYDKLKSLEENSKNINKIIDDKIKENNIISFFNYQLFPNSEIKYENTFKLHDINIDECKTICNGYSWCNSINHNKIKNKCYLSNSTIENNSNYVENVNFDLYQKKK